MRRMDLKPKTTKLEWGGKIAISADGEISVPRDKFLAFGTVLLTPNDFLKCFERTRQRLKTDHLDVREPVETIVKGYFKEERNQISNEA